MSDEVNGRNGARRFAGAGMLLAFALTGLLWACDDGRTPTRPSSPGAPPGGSPSSPVTIRLEIVGADSVPPGGTAQYSAMAHQSDGSTRDVTSEAVWRTWNASVLTVSSTGLATGHARGATNIETSAGGRSSNKEIIVVPTGTYRLSGVVREEGLPMAGVRVEVVAGTGQGFVAVTNVFGLYVFWGVAAAIEVRVTRDGYQEQRKSLQITSHQTLDFDLIPSRPRAEVAGSYTLTVTAAAECRAVLPEGARIRTYTAAVRQDGPRLTVTLEGPRFYSQGTRLLNSFRGTVEPGNVWFQLGGPYDYYGHFYLPDVFEEIDSTTYLAVSGSAVTTVSATGPQGALYGRIETLRSLADGRWETVASCFSTAHPFVFSR